MQINVPERITMRIFEVVGLGGAYVFDPWI